MYKEKVVTMMEMFTKFEAHDLHSFDFEKLIDLLNIEHARDREDLPSPIYSVNDFCWTWKIFTTSS